MKQRSSTFQVSRFHFSRIKFKRGVFGTLDLKLKPFEVVTCIGDYLLDRLRN